MRLTHNSLATVISWVSSCLLAGGLSTVFTESARSMWMAWGSFGLVAAVGLDVTARVREKMHADAMYLVTNRRYERDMKYEVDDQAASTAVREAVARILGRTPPVPTIPSSRRVQKRFLCDLVVELHLQDDQNDAGKDGASTRLARVTNLSSSGFELTIKKPLPRRRMEMIITAANGHKQKMFGEVLWDAPKADGSIVAGGRFLDAASTDDA